MDKLEEIEAKVDRLQEVVDTIGQSVSSILAALIDDTKMATLKKTMMEVEITCKNTGNFSN